VPKSPPSTSSCWAVLVVVMNVTVMVTKSAAMQVNLRERSIMTGGYRLYVGLTMRV
jgi:hypothetical protein